MIALDTHILARFYVDDPNDPEAAKQRPMAFGIFTESDRLFVPLTVVLELEGVLRAFYGFSTDDFARVITHLLGLANVRVEDWGKINDALVWHTQGLEFADALHLVASSGCETFLSFDDRRFARCAVRLKTQPTVKVPAA